MKDLELGQMLFGNPTQEYPVPREEWMSGPFEILMDAIAEKTGDKNFIYSPDFSNDFFTMRSYCWDYEDEEEASKPNFEVPSENFSLTWYKYPFRSSYSSEKLNHKRWNDLIQKCIKSLEENK
jgi:hypothetical protein